MFLFFDTETTGLPRDWNAPVTQVENWPRLVQLAWLLFDREGHKLEGAEHLIKPEGFVIPAESSRVHGITTEQALAEGVSLRSALEEFAAKIAAAELLVAHNMSFDEKIMGAEFLRSEIASGLFTTERVCTMLSSIEFCALPASNGKGYKWPRLSELHLKLFGEDFADAHDALVDTSACARCFFELYKRQVIDLPAAASAVATPPSRQGSLF